jgi:hypothetical protein
MTTIGAVTEVSSPARTVHWPSTRATDVASAVTVDADDVLLRRPVPLDGSRFPGHDDEKAAVPVSLPEQDVSRLRSAAPAQRG